MRTMGASFVNYHLRIADTAAVVHAAQERISGRAYISPARNGWVTLYDETSDAQDPAEIDRLSHDLSLALHVPLLAFLVEDSSLFAYYLFDDEGCLIDEYNSAPAMFGSPGSPDIHQRFAGQPVLLEQYCRPGVDLLELHHVLSDGRNTVDGGFGGAVPAEERVRELATLLGLNDRRAILGFNLFQMAHDALDDADQFTLVHSRRRPRNPRNLVLPRIPPKF
jgi:hypothetical protein